MANMDTLLWVMTLLSGILFPTLAGPWLQRQLWHCYEVGGKVIGLTWTLLRPRPWSMVKNSTADTAANSPGFRRKSSPNVDAIHDLLDRPEMAPAQLYSTESGRLFHSGRIAIATVGLPARGKTYVFTHSIASGDWTKDLILDHFSGFEADFSNVRFSHISVALARYLRWFVYSQIMVFGDFGVFPNINTPDFIYLG